ncbi:hypothetical protein [Microbulbifer sediminum]|uniref:hypothetical protein n=1 Tax=Microbulbifer sediminum TaxID=2904250 RepID=UPI001F2B1274|nr:hypothetical protein [Microbulbifer sediminum]
MDNARKIEARFRSFASLLEAQKQREEQGSHMTPPGTFSTGQVRYRATNARAQPLARL